MTINQRLILYRRTKKVFENRIKGIFYHKFKVNQHETLNYHIDSCGICYCIKTLSKEEVDIYSKEDLKYKTPEMYQIGLCEKYDMNVIHGYWFPGGSPCNQYELIARVEFLEKVIKYTKECIKKQQEI